jgi:acetylornithine deacetylase/succinyl-diaminopimelate desuccinylase-like protein
MHRGFLSRVQTLASSISRLLSQRPAGRPSRAHVAETGPYVSHILSDAILLNEIPSPTERESARTDFLLQRLSEFGYQGCELDDSGNVTAMVPAREETGEHVLLFADVRCEDYSPLESMTRLESERLRGKGIVENAIPATALLVLAEYLARNEIQYDRNVLFLFTSHATAEETVQPLERFLATWKDHLRYAVFLRGLGLGSAEDRPLGTCKLSLSARTEERAVLEGQTAVSAIALLAGISTRLGGIRWDSENSTFLNIARIEAGLGFGWFASEGTMDIELFSPNAGALAMAQSAVEATIAAVAAETGADIELTLKTFLPPGNPAINAELNGAVRRVHEKLRINSRVLSVPTYAALFTSLGVPAVTLGVAEGRKGVAEEYVEIDTLHAGFRQLLAFLDECANTRAGAPA